MRKSISKRIRVTKKAGIKRRSTTLGHSRSNKKTRQIKRKKNFRSFPIRKKTITQYL